MLRLAALIPVGWALLGSPGPAASAPPNSCVDCHGDLLAEAASDIHKAAGFSCADCHRGDPTQEDPELAMSPAKGFVGRPAAMATAHLCGRCHSDIERMRIVNPRLPTDQLAQYRTSHHGKLAAAGNRKVATCVSCHGAHGIKAVADPASPASKGRIVETCAGCHNPSYMAGAAVASDQLEKYSSSVHGRKRLLERDPAAPACADCHGNHGAAPPGVYSVTHVCGRCHATQAELFEASSHSSHFRELGVAPCTTCHSHHDIGPTDDAMLGTGERGTCGTCHQPGDRCDQVTGRMKERLAQLTALVARAQDALAQADRAGMDVEHPTFELTGATDAMVRARAEVHGFSEERFEAVVAEGAAAATDVEKAALAKLAELQFRRKGLAVASAVLLLFAGLLGLRARRVERSRPSS